MKSHFSTKAGLALVLCVMLGLSCASTSGTAHTLYGDADYQALGLARNDIALWEDGMRTSGKPGTYEWWYFDSVLSDGSTLVIVFYTKSMLKPGSELQPQVSLELDRPDGTKIHKFVQLDSKEASFSKDRCDIRIGSNTFTGDLHSYAIHVAVEDLTVDLELTGDVPAWRPETGIMNFKNGDEHFFAWLPSVPHGQLAGTLSLAGKTEAITGTGYHDHNWGDVSMLDLIHHWYWGRAQVGPYSVIASYITPLEKYGTQSIPVFMLARDGKILADDASKITLTLEGEHTNKKTGKPVADRIIYDYNDGKNQYRITFSRKAELMEQPFIDLLSGLERTMASLVGFDGAYLRFTGSVTVEKIEGSQTVDSATENSAVWELMYFGHAPAGNPTP